jgi:hypothetical protein
MRVNGQEADPGCYIAGHWGQYGMDRVADVCEQFDIAVGIENDTRHWRSRYEEALSQAEADRHWEDLVQSADHLEERLNEQTEGGYWEWEGGEFFLVQTEVEAWMYVPADEGGTYDDAWQWLLDNGTEGCMTGYDDLERGERAFRFRTTIHYDHMHAEEG